MISLPHSYSTENNIRISQHLTVISVYVDHVIIATSIVLYFYYTHKTYRFKGCVIVICESFLYMVARMFLTYRDIINAFIA